MSQFDLNQLSKKKLSFMGPPLVFLHLNIISEKGQFWIKEY